MAVRSASSVQHGCSDAIEHLGVSRFIGSWRLISYRAIMPDGSRRDPLGKEPLGRLTYDDQGHVSVQFGRRGRARFASEELRGGTLEEMKAAFHGYVAYFGGYRVDEAAGLVTHHVLGSLFPNWEGQDQKRFFELDGDRLTLTTPPTPAAGGMVTLVLDWERERRGAG